MLKLLPVRFKQTLSKSEEFKEVFFITGALSDLLSLNERMLLAC